MNTHILALLGFFCLFAFAFAQDQPAEENKDVAPVHTVTTGSDGSIVIPAYVVSMLTNGGAVAAGITALAALIMLLLPAFGIRLCSLFNTCETTPFREASYSAAPNSVYSEYTYPQGTFNNPSYQKRSIEYVGPILKALGTAYDRYHRAATQTASAQSTKPASS